MNPKRREFLSKAFTSVAGSALLARETKAALLTRAGEIPSGDGSAGQGEPYWEQVKSHFPFAQDLHYFNNASLGPSPQLVAEATNEFRRTLDMFPSKYMWGGWNREKEEVRRKSAAAFGVSPEEIALIHNTTEGMNVVASSLDLQPGDEVILCDHEHPSGTIPWRYWQESRGVKLVRPVLPLLPAGPGEIVDLYRKAITGRTRAISMCHMVNTNGMILPVREIAELARPRGILVAVDGAQAAGMFRFSLAELGCDFYAASAHKWLFSPKGVGILYVRQESQRLLRPLIVASGYEDRSIRRFENYNTRNLPEVLGFGTALDYEVMIGRERKERRIHELKGYFRGALADDPRFLVRTPAGSDLSAGITTVELQGMNATEAGRILTERYRIDTRPMTSHGLNGLRISLSIFNSKGDIDRLVHALGEIIDRA